MKTNKEKNRRKRYNLMKLFALLTLVFFIFKPGQVEAAEHEVSTPEEMKEAIANAADEDIIKIKDIKGVDDIKDFTGDVVTIDKDLTLMANLEHERRAEFGTIWRDVYFQAYLKNVQFDIAVGKTLTLENIKILGIDGKDVVVGDGNLILQDGNAIKAKPNQNAVNLSEGKVEIKKIEKKKENKDFEHLKEDPGETITIWEGIIADFDRGYNWINGGDGAGSDSGGSAIIAASFVMVDDTNQAFIITGGNSDEGKGGYAISATDIDLDLAHTYTYPHGVIKIDIKGGDGKFPAGAIKGKEITLVAGDGRIKPGIGKDENHDISFAVTDENYTATVEVEAGGHLKFGKSDLEHSKKSSLAGFSHSFYYGPTILAKGDADVTIRGGASAWSCPEL